MQHYHPSTQGLARQRGNTILIILVVVVGLMALFIFNKERSRAAAKAEQQRIETVQREEAAKALREQEAKAQSERVAIEDQARKAQEEQRDAYVQALKRFDDIVIRFNDANRVASSTSRIALSQPVATMQSMHREASQLSAPPCLALGKEDLVTGMKEIVDGYLIFMQNPAKKGDELAQQYFKAADPSILRYRDLRAACPAP